MNETIGMALIIVGLVFDFLGCLGLIRFPDVYNRIQASAKCVTLGTCGILFGLFLFKGLSATGIKALLCLLLCLQTLGCHRASTGPTLPVQEVHLWSVPPEGALQPAARSLTIGNQGEVIALDTAGRVLVGASRKSFLGVLAERGGVRPAPDARLGASLASALVAAQHGAAAVRVHDVAETRQALDVLAGIEGSARRA